MLSKLLRQAIILFTVSLFLGTIQLHAADSGENTFTDSWQAMRKGFDFKGTIDHPAVQSQLKWILNHPSYLRRLAERSRPYMYYILQEVRKRHMPSEIALLPMIESAYDPFAYSSVGAAGLWQLMPGTGTGLGVKQDWWYDGRRDIHASTTAALNYLEYLNKFFDGNWTLAVAAYDSGEGTVQRAIKRNKKLNKDTDFWSLKLPRETRNYIPRLLALASIIQYPKYYKVKLPSIPYQPYFVKVKVGSQIDLSHAAELADIKYQQLIKLNPGYNRWATAPNRPFDLVLPIEKAEQFKENLSSSPKNKRVSWKRHTVVYGDSLSTIARAYQTSVHLIKNINHLTTDLIRSGQVLLIPGSKKLPAHTIAETKRRQSINHAKKIGPHKVVHIVQKGDSFWLLEKKYRVRAAAIRFWNQMTYSQALKVGEKLVIWVKNTPKKNPVRYYSVKAGDSISQIAYKNHATIAEIKRWNPKLGKIIYPKQRIRLYG